MIFDDGTGAAEWIRGDIEVLISFSGACAQVNVYKRDELHTVIQTAHVCQPDGEEVVLTDK